jgi:AbrB family looped-hinge helix DNA binding protein
VGNVGWIARLNGKGRIVIPREIRDRIGLKKGDHLSLEVRDSQIVLMPLQGHQPIDEHPKAKLRSFLHDD